MCVTARKVMMDLDVMISTNARLVLTVATKACPNVKTTMEATPAFVYQVSRLKTAIVLVSV